VEGNQENHTDHQIFYLGHHKESGQEATLKKLKLHQTLRTRTRTIPLKKKKKKKTLSNSWKLPANSNHQSNVSKELKFRKSSTD
jgi:hypothetical protein